ncbi:hypothetical protein PMZ80_002081 [Knufia obscura]|uniref:NACHT domain-containing protein n=1 Tax=Knufia obscura TaxID=1635080 RepID=A0ABR0RWA0_9EURO|nr:hypothetical protein PMZ80_002081 [Knufia obscura]
MAEDYDKAAGPVASPDQEQRTGSGHHFGNIYASGNAFLHLGDDLVARTEEQAKQKQKQRHGTETRVGLYYTAMNTRRWQLGESPKAALEWIWNSKFCAWLRSKEELFWICGKPGSGKSTLVNYLSTSKRLLVELSVHGAQWSVIDFHFDFRAGEDTANTKPKLGLLKSLVYQLLDENEAFREYVDAQNCLEETWFDREERLVEHLIGGLREMKGNVLIFIDGLDECAVHLGQLTTSLLRIQRQSNVKMCLASRPEPILLRLLSKFPVLQMQDFNVATIRDHIRMVCEHFDADESTSLEPLWIEVEREANGVILWARFVVDELFEQRISGATMKELQEKLRTYPKELKDVYARILSRLSEKEVIHAAIAFYALRTGQQYFASDIGLPIYEFFILWVVMVEVVDEEMVFDRGFDINQFRSRLHAMLGGLIEFSDALNVVRYVHKTLESYLEEPNKVKALMEQYIRPMSSDDPDKFTKEVFSIVIRKAIAEIECTEQDFQKAIYEIQEPRDTITCLHKVLPEGHWYHRSAFLLRAIDEYPKLLSNSEADVPELCHISASPLFMLHCRVADESGYITCGCDNTYSGEAQTVPYHLCFLARHDFTRAFKCSFNRSKSKLTRRSIELIITFIALTTREEMYDRDSEYHRSHARRRDLIDFLFANRKPSGHHILIWLMIDFDKPPEYVLRYHERSVKVELGSLLKSPLCPWPSVNLLCCWAWLSDDAGAGMLVKKDSIC